LLDVDRIAADLRRREQERSSAAQLRLYRRKLFEEQGPVFFRDLLGEVQRGCKELARRNPKWESAIFEPAADDRNFTARNSHIRPLVKVGVHLTTVNLIVRVEERQNAVDTFILDRQHRIDFSLDDNDRLALCMECSAVSIDDVTDLIVRALFGLPKR
jgi:hypothetical protein